MYDIKVSLDKERFSSKPTGNEAAKISNRIPGSTETLECPTGVFDFVHDVGMFGQTFSPTTFNGTRDGNSFEQMQLLALDFDGGISYKEAHDRAIRYELPVFFAYETLSSSDNNEKFRLVFLNDIPITDKKAAKICKNALMTVFPEADKTDNDIAKMYFGGTGVKHYDPRLLTINLESLNRNMTIYLKDKHGVTNYKRELLKFSKINKIALNKNGLLDISMMECPTEDSGADLVDNSSPNAILLYKTNGEKLSDPFSSHSSRTIYRINLDNGSPGSSIGTENKVRRNHNEYRSSNLNDIGKSCNLYNEFESGSRQLKYHELFGIATNIIQIESGVKKFNEILVTNSYYDDREFKYSKWEKDFSVLRMNDYKPTSCDSFCPYFNICEHGTNILSTIKPKMERLANHVEVFHPIKEVEEDVRRAIFKAYHFGNKMMNVVKAQVSIGKTTSYLKLMEDNPFDRFLIACPTNILKDEVYDKAVKAGLNVIKTPSLVVIKNEMPAKVRKKIDLLYKTGRHRSVHPYIAEMLKKKDIPCLQEYMDEREKLKNFDGSVITTHRYLLNMDEKRLREYDAVIIDEDIIFKSIISNQGEITVSELKKLLRSATNGRLIMKIKKLIKHFESKTEPTIELPSFEWDDEDEAEGMSTPFDTPSFCLAKYFYCRRVSKEKNLKEDTIAFLKPVFFKNMKYIMVSATVDEKICCNYFGEDNVNFYECKKAKCAGTLNQYYGKSMSRSCIDDNPGIIKNLMKKFGISEDKVITFMKYGIGPLHYGNTEGCNTLEGQDILVIGTPYHAEFLYKLFAFSLGLDFDNEAEMKLDRIVTRNGYKFPITTYDDKELRDIHFWMLESELEQAVGRARLLRHPCTVNLFSNFPLWQAVMKDDKYWKS